MQNLIARMKNIYTRIVSILLVSGLFTAVHAQVPVDPALAAGLQNKIDGYISQYNIPGISVTVLLPGDQIWSGASGLSHIYDFTVMDTSHVFEMASVTKMYTAAIIFQLMEEGQLSLDDTVGQYLPAMNNIPSGTTIRNMLKHRSGLYNYTNNSTIGYEWFNNPDSIWPHLQMINTYVNAPPSFLQGASFSYSNTNYFLLGMIIEAITGNVFADELRNRILIPHGLSEIYFPPVDSLPATVTPGWTSFTTTGVYDTDASAILNDCSRSMAYAAGAMLAKPADACKFTKLLWTGNIISDSSLNIMKQCTNVTMAANCNGYGYGAMRYVFNSKTYYGHSGDINGFTQITFYGPADSVGVIISINRNSAPRGPITIDLMNYINQALTTSIDNIENDNPDFSVYPNPASEIVHIKFNSPINNNTLISITDQVGKLIMHDVNYISSDNNKFTLDISDLQAGIYFIHLNVNDKILTRKIVVARNE